MSDFKFEGYSWIKVPKHKINKEQDPAISLKELEAHHIQETTFLINKVRELGKMLEEIKEVLNDKDCPSPDICHRLRECFKEKEEIKKIPKAPLPPTPPEPYVWKEGRLKK